MLLQQQLTLSVAGNKISANKRKLKFADSKSAAAVSPAVVYLVTRSCALLLLLVASVIEAVSIFLQLVAVAFVDAVNLVDSVDVRVGAEIKQVTSCWW